jgi:antitoxin HicB
MAALQFEVWFRPDYMFRTALRDTTMGEANTERTYTIQLRPEPEGGFTVLVPALPPVVTYGETYEEAVANAREAIELVLAVYRDEGIEIPRDIETRFEKLVIAA